MEVVHARKWWWIPYLLVLILVASIVVVVWLCCFQRVTTVLLVRHAEKSDSTTTDPPLSAAGEARAQVLVHVAGGAGVRAVFATQFLRTQQTVQPLATRLGLTVIQVDSGDVAGLVNQLLTTRVGTTFLVAGHNNTVPQIIQGLRADPLCPSMFPLNQANQCVIPESQYDNLFVVTAPRLGKARVLRLKYGVPTP